MQRINSMVSAREDGFTTDASFNIQVFSKGTIYVSFEFSVHFFNKGLTWEVLLSEVRKTARIRHISKEVRNSSATARAIYNYHKRLLKFQKPSTLLIGESMAKCLSRYTDVWDRYFGKHNVNLRIGWDKVEDVIWRIRNFHANKEARCFTLWNK